MKRILFSLTTILILLTSSSVLAGNSKISETNVSQSTTDDAWFTLDDVVQTAFSPDGRYLAVRTSTHFQVYDMQQSAPTLFIETGSYADIHFEAPIGFSPDSRWVAVDSLESYPARTIHLWDIETGEMVAEISHDFYTVTGFLYSPTEPILMIAHRSGEEYWMGQVTVWDYEQNRIIDSFNPGGGPNLQSFRPDGTQVLIHVANGTGGWIMTYDIDSHITERFFSGGVIVDCPCDVSPTWDYLVVSTSTSYSLRVLELPSGETMNLVRYSDGYFGDSDWNDDGSLLALKELTGRVRIFDLENDRSWTVGVAIDTQKLRSIDIHPSLNIILLGYEDNNAEVWDMETSTLLHTTSTTSHGYDAFSPDGRFIFGTVDNGYHIWDAETGTLIYDFERVDAVQTVEEISPDDNLFLVRTFFKGQLWVWRLDE